MMAIAAACLLAPGAWAAVWTGARGTDIADPDNWDGEIATEPMLFGMDANTTLSQDLTVYGIFKNSEHSASYSGRTVVFDLGGHTLTSQNAGNRYLNNTTYRFTNGTILNVSSSGVTNSITLDNQNYPRCCIEVAGVGTKFVGDYGTRAKQASGHGARFRVLDGAEAFGASFSFGGRYATNEVSGAASLTAASAILVGCFASTAASHSYNYGNYHDVLMVSGGSTLTGGALYVGHGFLKSSAGSHDNHLLVSGGSTVSVSTFNLGTSGPNYNNTVEVSGEGTTFTASGKTMLGTDSSTSAATGTPHDNAFIVSEGATATLNGTTDIGCGGTNNAFIVRSGAKLSVPGNYIYLGYHDSNAGAKSRVEATGAGTEAAFGNLDVRNNTGDASLAHQVIVSDGALLTANRLTFNGPGNMIAISNATVSVVNNLWTSSGSGTIFRFSGAVASLSASGINDTNKSILGSPVFEYTIPESGWATAPLRFNTVFTVPSDVTLRVDAESVKSYLKANPRGGTVPLMTTGSSSRAITVADMDALSAILPDGCSLVNESGVLSLKIKSGLGSMLIVF